MSKIALQLLQVYTMATATDTTFDATLKTLHGCMSPVHHSCTGRSFLTSWADSHTCTGWGWGGWGGLLYKWLCVWSNSDAEDFSKIQAAIDILPGQRQWCRQRRGWYACFFCCLDCVLGLPGILKRDCRCLNLDVTYLRRELDLNAYDMTEFWHTASQHNTQHLLDEASIFFFFAAQRVTWIINIRMKMWRRKRRSPEEALIFIVWNDAL